MPYESGTLVWVSAPATGGAFFPGASLFSDGTAAAPSIAWASDADGTGTGLYRNTTDNIGVSIAGTLAWQWNAAGHLSPAATSTRDLGGTATQIRDMFVARSIEGSTTKTLVETTATNFVSISVANSTAIAGRVVYSIRASDATDAQGLTGELFFSAVATSAGAVTAAISDQHILNPVSAGTLTNTMTNTTAANLITLLANATSSLTQTTLRIDYRVELMGNTASVTAL